MTNALNLFSVQIIFMFIFMFVFIFSDGALNTQKDIWMEVNCTTVSREKHFFQTCSIVNLTITNLDDNPFQLTQKQFLENAKKFLHKDSLNGTCFRNAIHVNYASPDVHHFLDEFEISTAVKHSGRGNVKGESVYSLECFELGIHLYDAFLENATDGCILYPLGLDVNCTVHYYKLAIKLIAILEITDDSSYRVLWKLQDTIKTHKNLDECIEISGYGSEMFEMHLKEENCKGSYVAPLRTQEICPWKDGPYYTWKNCTKEAYGVEILHLDQRYDDLIFNDITTFCQSKWPVMYRCLKNAPCGGYSPIYWNLEVLYFSVCNAPRSFYAVGYKCMKEILSNRTTNAAYSAKARNCSYVVEGWRNSCRKLQVETACTAVALYDADRGCSTFLEIYNYQWLVNNRNNINGPCPTSNPCSLDFVKDAGLCSGSHLRISVAVLMIVLLTALKLG